MFKLLLVLSALLIFNCGGSSVVPATVSVSGVSVDESTVSIVDGLTATILATVSPANATDKSVTWSSSDDQVATVDQSGVITAALAGTATITVTTTDGSRIATIVVTVTAGTVSVTSVNVDLSEVSLEVGSTATVVATVEPATATDKTVTWSSSDDQVATVDQSGVITAEGVGTANITVTTTDGSHTATIVVTVTAGTISVSGVNVDLVEVSLEVGSTATVVATVEPATATDKTVTWSSSDDQVATVDQSGVITAEGEGTATIIVTTTDGSRIATVIVTVIAAPIGTISVSGVSVDGSIVSIVDGLTATILATVSPANATDKSVIWSSSDAQIATVDNGVITAEGVGTADITVTTSDGSHTATVAVTVTAAPIGTISVSGVSVDESTVSIVNELTATVVATVSPANATDNSVTWSSSDDQVATVDQSGEITAVGVGTATITVTTTDGPYTATVAVTVTPILVSSVSVGSATVGIVDGSTATVTATVLPANAANKGLMWSSSDAQVATVTQSGVITAVGVGTATITVTTQDASNITETIVVTVTAGTVSVTGVSISGSVTISIVDESTATVTATVSPGNATDNSVTWSSSDDQVATVDQSGEITAVGVGTATITVTTTDGPYTATVAVTVTPILVSSVSVKCYSRYSRRIDSNSNGNSSNQLMLPTKD